MSAEPTLGQLLARLAESVEDYSAATKRAEGMLLERIIAAEDDTAALRDDTVESLAALGNRLEGLTRALMTEPAEVAARIVTDANNEQVRRLRDADS